MIKLQAFEQKCLYYNVSNNFNVSNKYQLRVGNTVSKHK